MLNFALFHIYKQVGQLSQTNRLQHGYALPKIKVEDELCTKRCRYRKARSIDLFTRYPSRLSTKMSAVITLSVGKTAKNTIIIHFNLCTATVNIYLIILLVWGC